MKRIALTLASSVLALAALAGCNTVQGFGQDVQQGGRAIERAAK